MNFRRIAATLAAMALPDIAHAHVGLHTDGALAGFSHPFSGLDHILAMVAVGFWALTLGGKARWVVPLAFVTVMAVGGGLGICGVAFPMVETGIALTIALLGLLVAFEVKVSTSVAATVVGTCGLFHGHAHGTELPAMAHAGGYVAGFMAATVILHLAGFGLALLRFGNAQRVAAQTAGVVIALPVQSSWPTELLPGLRPVGSRMGTVRTAAPDFIRSERWKEEHHVHRRSHAGRRRQ